MVTPFVPPAVHTAVVDVVKVTAKPDEAVALTVNGDALTVIGESATRTFGNGRNVMVCDAFCSATVAGAEAIGPL
jgi:hypothetical protein